MQTKSEELLGSIACIGVLAERNGFCQAKTRELQEKKIVVCNVI
jgi:hypothetical protein